MRKIIYSDELMHYGRSKRDGAPKGSGRYPLGSGEDPRAPGIDDATLEAIGKAAQSTGKDFTNTAKVIRSLPKKEARKASSYLDISSMSDADMRKYINRRVIEEQYKNLYDKEHPIRDSDKGRKFVANILEYGGGALGMASSAMAIYVALKRLGV